MSRTSPAVAHAPGTTLVVTQGRRWSYPQSWMFNGWSTACDKFHRARGARMLDLPPGGWSLSAATLIRLEWDGDPEAETSFKISIDQRIVHWGLWRPVANRTMVDQFFWDGDLCVMHYRWWVRGDRETGLLPIEAEPWHVPGR